MTIRERITQMLIDNMLFEDEAKMILSEAENDKSLESMSGRWNDDIKGYSNKLLIAVWFSVKAYSISWLEKNIPTHFALNVLKS